MRRGRYNFGQISTAGTMRSRTRSPSSGAWMAGWRPRPPCHPPRTRCTPSRPQARRRSGGEGVTCEGGERGDGTGRDAAPVWMGSGGAGDRSARGARAFEGADALALQRPYRGASCRGVCPSWALSVGRPPRREPPASRPSLRRRLSHRSRPAGSALGAAHPHGVESAVLGGLGLPLTTDQRRHAPGGAAGGRAQLPHAGPRDRHLPPRSGSTSPAQCRRRPAMGRRRLLPARGLRARRHGTDTLLVAPRRLGSTLLLLASVTACGGSAPEHAMNGDTASLFVVRVIEPKRQSGAPPPLLVLLHGIGADENDLAPLAAHLDGRVRVASLRAPRPWTPGHAWFHLDFRADGTIVPDVAQAHATLVDLTRWLEQAPGRYHTDERRTYLLGFSQGAMMALGVLRTIPQRLAGVIALSGRAPEGLFPEAAPRPAIAEVPLLVAHGTADPVLEVQNGRQVRDAFGTVSKDFTYQEFPIGHTISEAELGLVASWLTQHLDQPAR